MVNFIDSSVVDRWFEMKDYTIGLSIIRE